MLIIAKLFYFLLLIKWLMSNKTTKQKVTVLHFSTYVVVATVKKFNPILGYYQYIVVLMNMIGSYCISAL